MNPARLSLFVDSSMRDCLYSLLRFDRMSHKESDETEHACVPDSWFVPLFFHSPEIPFSILPFEIKLPIRMAVRFQSAETDTNLSKYHHLAFSESR